MGWGDNWEDKWRVTNIGNDVTLQIPLNSWVSRDTKAIQVGDLAVVAFEEDFDWCIIHVPTLTRFDNALPEPSSKGYSEEQLIKWCWKVQQSTGPNWTVLREFNNSTYKNISKDLLERIKQYCLSIGVE